MPRLLAALLLLALAPPVAAAPPAPTFTIKRLDGGGPFESRSHLGRHVVVVRFQASWCRVCGEEAAAIERIYRKYKSSDIELVAVHVQDTEADARRFLEAHKATYPAGLDPRLRIAKRFGFRGTPYTVVINRQGEMVARIHGRTTEARLARILDPLVKPPPRKPPARLQ